MVNKLSSQIRSETPLYHRTFKADYQLHCKFVCILLKIEKKVIVWKNLLEDSPGFRLTEANENSKHKNIPI